MSNEAFRSAHIDYCKLLTNEYGRDIKNILVDVEFDNYRSSHRVEGPITIHRYYNDDTGGDFPKKKFVVYLKGLIDELMENNSLLDRDIAILDTRKVATKSILYNSTELKSLGVDCGSVHDCYQQKLCVDAFYRSISHEWKCVTVIVDDNRDDRDQQIYTAKSRCQSYLVVVNRRLAR